MNNNNLIKCFAFGMLMATSGFAAAGEVCKTTTELKYDYFGCRYSGFNMYSQ